MGAMAKKPRLQLEATLGLDAESVEFRTNLNTAKKGSTSFTKN
jgi:hypothetical protein